MESVLSFILGVGVLVVALLGSIALHEVGHLVPAKIFGVKVTQYMIGFGPTLWSRRRGETEYGVKAIPLGGYVSMIGMYPPARAGERARTAGTGFFTSVIDDARAASAETVGEGEDHRAFYRLPMGKKIIVMAGGPIMNLIIALVLFTVVISGFGVAQSTTTLSTVTECVVPVSEERSECLDTDPLAPGAQAGLRAGDQILAVNGTPVTEWDQISGTIRDSAGVPLQFEIRRGETTTTVEVVPQATERYRLDDRGQVVTGADGEPETMTVGFVGISPGSARVPQPIGEAFVMVGDNIVQVGRMILTLPQRLVQVAQAAFGPEERDPNGPISVVGVGRVAGEVASLEGVDIADKTATLLALAASLNVALAVFNLVPLMPLDGGHIAGALWEGLRRWIARLRGRPDPGPVDTAKAVPFTLAVVAVLGASSLLLIYADLVKPINLFG